VINKLVRGTAVIGNDPVKRCGGGGLGGDRNR